MAGSDYFPNLLKMQALYDYGRYRAVNTLWARCTAAGGATQGELNTVATAIGEAWTSNIMPLITNGATFEVFSVADWTSNAGLTGLGGAQTQGGDSSLALPANAACLINFQVASRYRGGHPRIYLPPPGVDKTDGALNWSTSFQDAMDTAFTEVFTTINSQTIAGEDLVLSLYHRGSKDIPANILPINTFQTSLAPATIRRRLRRAGHKK